MSLPLRETSRSAMARRPAAEAAVAEEEGAVVAEEEGAVVAAEEEAVVVAAA